MNIQYQLDRLRQELELRIASAVTACGGCIGVYYYNMGKRYKDCPSEDATGEFLAVNIKDRAGARTCNALLIELYTEPGNPMVMCLVNDEAGNDTELPTGQLTIESLEHLHSWLCRHEFIEEQPLWRCSCCGSSDVEERIWITVNTGEERSSAENRNEYYCNQCDCHDWPVTHNDLMRDIEKWYSEQSQEQGQNSLPNTDRWNTITDEEKIEIWSEHQKL